MARIAAITLSSLSFRKIPKKKVVFVINFILYISIFAVTASISAYFMKEAFINLKKKLQPNIRTKLSIIIGFQTHQEI